MSSMLWYACTSWPAPFGPIPGTPGMQSDESPWMALISIISFGETP